MLVFISDIHFTDSTTIGSMKPGAFAIFCRMLEDIISRSTAEEVTLVMLGGILDLLRFGAWQDTSLRPWSDIAERDAGGRDLEDVTVEIVRRIAGDPANIESVSHIHARKATLKHKGVDLEIDCIPGKHDRLLNLFPTSRGAAANFLGLERSPDGPLPAEKLWPKHRVLARHGDIHDPLNYDGKDQPSSLGDAIVIELLNRFPDEIRKELGDNDEFSELLTGINDVDYVRPLIDIPAYISFLCRKHGKRGVTVKVKRAWHRLAGQFIELPFVTEHDRPFRWDLVNSLKAALFFSRTMSVERIAAAVSNRHVRQLYHSPGRFARYAAEEEAFENSAVDFVVYGHTHKSVVLPISNSEKNGKKERFYFNTGTWREVFEKSLSARRKHCFARRNVMTFVCIFKDGERISSEGESRRFETWTGSLA